MSTPLFLNLRVLSLYGSSKVGGAIAEVVMTSMAGSGVDSAAKFTCEFHPVADDGAHWGVSNPEVYSESRFSLLDMFRGPTPDVPSNGESVSRNSILASMLSRTLNELHFDRKVRAVKPDELNEFVHNRVFVFQLTASESPLRLMPTGIEQKQLMRALASLSPVFSEVPSYYLEPTSDAQVANQIVQVLPAETSH